MDKDCGRCSICIDRCPTGAIVAPYTVSAPRCISFQTIEQRGAIPAEIRPPMGSWIFGCDHCQEVCPYTKAARPADDPEIRPQHVDNAFPSLLWLLRMSEEEFRARYRGTAVLRAKRRGLARNAAVALANSGHPAALPALLAAFEGHDEELVRAHAAWGVGRLGGKSARNTLDRRRSVETPLVRTEIERALEAA
jgi:epoxyqueuosine reductase